MRGVGAGSWGDLWTSPGSPWEEEGGCEPVWITRSWGECGTVGLSSKCLWGPPADHLGCCFHAQPGEVALLRSGGAVICQGLPWCQRPNWGACQTLTADPPVSQMPCLSSD